MTKSLLLGLLFLMLLASGAAAEDLASVPLGPNADLGGVRLLPDDSPWNQDILPSNTHNRASMMVSWNAL